MLNRLLAALRLALTITGALWAVVTFTPVVKWIGARLSTEWSQPEGDVLILLGGGVVAGEGTPTGLILAEGSYWRAVHAIHVWHHAHFRKLLVCGSGAADAVTPFLTAHGIPEDAIIVENHSHSTRENALFAKPLLAGAGGRFVLLTSDYHTYRASRCFAREGIRVHPHPCPDVLKRVKSWRARWDCFFEVSSELSKILYYRARGWM
jgi:uncharacterized SAM-binding protein YcdF (DUF218 family)